MKRTSAFLVILLATPACDSPAPSDCAPYWSDAAVVEAARAHIREPGNIWLEEVWRVGGVNDEQGFAAPASVALSGSGYTAVVDYQLGEVIVIQPDGQWLGPWGRKGHGPGELIMPVAAVWNGDTLRVFDIEQAKVASFVAGSSFGTERMVPREFVAPVVASGEIDYVAVRADGSVLLKYPLEPSGNRDSVVAAVLMSRPGAEGADTLAVARVRAVTWETGGILPVPGAVRPVVAVGPDRWLAMAASDGSYRILLRDPRDSAVHQICRRTDPVVLSSAERGQGPHTRGFEEAAAALANSGQAESPASVGRLLVGSSGEVWVQRDRPAPFTNEALYGVPGAAFDVFDPTGRFAGEVKPPAGVMLQAVSQDLAVGLSFGNLDEAVIIGYRVRRTSD